MHTHTNAQAHTHTNKHTDTNKKHTDNTNKKHTDTNKHTHKHKFAQKQIQQTKHVLAKHTWLKNLQEQKLMYYHLVIKLSSISCSDILC